MTLNDDLKNVKGRIREAMYAGKGISILFDFSKFYPLCTGGVHCTSTPFFSSYINASRFLVYCRPSILLPMRELITSELKKYTQEIGGNLI